MTDCLATKDGLLCLLSRAGAATDLPRPFAREILLLKCHVAGTSYRDLGAIEDSLRAGDELTLRREPGNEHDELAMQILTARDALLGYVPRASNEAPARLMDAGKLLFARLTGRRCENRWLKIDVQIFMREL